MMYYCRTASKQYRALFLEFKIIGYFILRIVYLSGKKPESNRTVNRIVFG